MSYCKPTICGLCYGCPGTLTQAVSQGMVSVGATWDKWGLPRDAYHLARAHGLSPHLPGRLMQTCPLIPSHCSLLPRLSQDLHQTRPSSLSEQAGVAAKTG